MLPLMLALALFNPQISSSSSPSKKFDACPLIIRVRASGTLITHRFDGWRVTSMRTLESDLKGGCYNDANPSMVTSLTIEASKEAPPAKLKLLYEALSRGGWQRNRITIR